MPLNKAGVDAAALAAMPKGRGADAAAVEGRGVLMARAKGADAAAEAVLAGVLDGAPGN